MPMKNELLTPRQQRAAHKDYVRGGIALWHRVGAGKTRVLYKSFATVANRVAKREGRVSRFVVVCRREAFFDWENEATKCSLNWKFVQLETPDDIYQGSLSRIPVVYLVSHGKLAKLRDCIVDEAHSIDAVAYDEGWLYKNPSTHHCKAANKISIAVGRASILSGSVMTARDLTDIYGQLTAINKHQCLARTLTEFRSRFMYRFSINPTASTQAIAWRNARGAAKRIAKRVRPITSVFMRRSATRNVVSDIRRIPASVAQTRAFQQLREWFELEHKGQRIELKNTPSVITKCQQVSDGIVNMDGRYSKIQSGKLLYLTGVLRELVEAGEKIVVWCAFRRSVRHVLQALQKAFPRIGIYPMCGGMAFDHAGWTRDGRIAVATEASGSSVNYFKDCAYAIYYSMSFKWHDLQQSRGRTDRHDSAHSTCYYYYFQTEGSLDPMVYRAAHTSGKRESEFVQEAGVKVWLKS